MGEAIKALNLKIDQVLEIVTQLNTANVEAQASAIAADLTADLQT